MVRRSARQEVHAKTRNLHYLAVDWSQGFRASPLHVLNPFEKTLTHAGQKRAVRRAIPRITRARVHKFQGLITGNGESNCLLNESFRESARFNLSERSSVHLLLRCLIKSGKGFPECVRGQISRGPEACPNVFALNKRMIQAILKSC